MHSYTSLRRKDWSTLQCLQPLLYRLLILQLHWKHSPKSHSDQCCQSLCYIQYTLLGTSWGFSSSDQITLSKYFFSSFAYLVSVRNPQSSLHSPQALLITAGEFSHTHGFPWNCQASYWVAFAAFPQGCASLWMVIPIYLEDNWNSTFSFNNYIPLASVLQMLPA